MCHLEKYLIEYNFHRKDARHTSRCKDCVKAAKKTNPDEWEKIRRNTSQPERYVYYFPDSHKKKTKPDMGRAADGSCYNF